jgi:hypothetical protein
MISIRYRLRALIIFLALGISAHCGSIAAGEDAPPRTLSPLLEPILRWLPEDTETLIVAQACEIFASRATAENELVIPSLQPMVCGLAFGESDFVAEGKCLRPLAGRKVKLAATGSRNFERVSSFGSLRCEGCTFIVLDEPLPEAGAGWTQLLGKEAKEVRRLLGRDVFVFPSPTEMEPCVKPHRWQGAYFVLLKPDTILCATSDRFLEEVLRRVDAAPITRALPEKLTEWKHVDATAPVWMLRHIHQSQQGALISGLTWTCRKDHVEVVYLPLSDAASVAEPIRSRWPNSPAAADPRVGRVEKHMDGTLHIAIPSLKLSIAGAMTYGGRICLASGEDEFLGTR